MKVHISRFHLLIACAVAFCSLSLVVDLGSEPDYYLSRFNGNIQSFRKTIVDNKIHYTLSLIPKELRVIQQHKNGIINSNEAQQRLDSDDSSIEFMLEIEIPSNGNQEFLKYPADSLSYEDRVEYFSFGFGKDISIQIDNEVEKEVSGYVFERNFGVSPKGVMSFFIDASKNAKEIKIQFMDQVYGSETQMLEFKLDDLKKLPRLKKVKKWKIKEK